MSSTPQQSIFGQLFTSYRSDQGFSQAGLQRLLQTRGYCVTTSTINRYERGRRRPPPAFLYHAAQCLHLDDKQTVALLQAQAADLVLQSFRAYHVFLKGLPQHVRESASAPQQELAFSHTRSYVDVATTYRQKDMPQEAALFAAVAKELQAMAQQIAMAHAK